MGVLRGPSSSTSMVRSCADGESSATMTIAFTNRYGRQPGHPWSYPGQSSGLRAAPGAPIRCLVPCNMGLSTAVTSKKDILITQRSASLVSLGFNALFRLQLSLSGFEARNPPLLVEWVNHLGFGKKLHETFHDRIVVGCVKCPYHLADDIKWKTNHSQKSLEIVCRVADCPYYY